jgi:DMSO/TMAO reductase YedYZ molybdopterin-dependent catalytic subunit
LGKVRNKKTTIIIIVLVAVLAVALGVTAYLNMGDFKEKKAQQENAIIVIKSGDKKLAEVNMDYITGLGEKEFKANLKKSGKQPVEHSYTGVPMKNLFENLKIDTGNVSLVVLKAIDGYTSALTLSEVMEDDNVYIAYKIDGKSLGNEENGGDGPYMAIIRKDSYSQRWCKFLTEIDLQ